MSRTVRSTHHLRAPAAGLRALPPSRVSPDAQAAACRPGGRSSAGHRAGRHCLRPSTSITRCSPAGAAWPWIAPVSLRCAVDEAHRHAAPGLDLQHAGHARQRARGARRRPGRWSTPRCRRACARLKLVSTITSIASRKKLPMIDDRHRGGDAAGGDRRAQRAGARCCAGSCAAPGRCAGAARAPAATAGSGRAPAGASPRPAAAAPWRRWR